MIIAEAGSRCHDLLCDYLSTQFDPAHILSELGFTIVFDLILIWLVWGKLIKPYINRKVQRAHQELDEEHGVEHPVKAPERPVERRTRATGGNDTGPGTHVCKCRHRTYEDGVPPL